MRAVPKPVVIAYLKGLVMEGTVHLRWLMRHIVEVENNLVSLNPFLKMACFGAVRRLLYELMILGCHGYGALVLVPIAVIEERFGLGILLLIQNMEADSFLALVAVARIAEVGRAAMLDQERLLYDYMQGVLLLSTEGGVADDQGP